MKIIDILNKKANETLEDGFKFAYEDKIYTYNKKKNRIINNNTDRLIGQEYNLEMCLNDAVLLFQNNTEAVTIEKNKEIEELEISEDNRRFYTDFIISIVDKLNEVINKLKKEREEK